MRSSVRLRTVIVALVAVCAASLVVIFALQRAFQHKLDDLSQKARKFDEYCALVRISVRQDARDFRDPKHQATALTRFYDGPSLHNAGDIHRCVTRELDFDSYTFCWLTKNYDCLADLADEVVSAIPAWTEN